MEIGRTRFFGDDVVFSFNTRTARILLQKRKKKLNLANGTVVGGNQSPMLRHTLQMGVDFEKGGNRSARRRPLKSG